MMSNFSAGVNLNTLFFLKSILSEKTRICEKEGTEWVALRMCLSCGHVGCCDSSIGLHATKHFQKTNHPVMLLHRQGVHPVGCYGHRNLLHLQKPTLRGVRGLISGAFAPWDYSRQEIVPIQKPDLTSQSVVVAR
jgi:ubiquitin-hydrolase Zn-finger-containing protein